jgi:DNA ligase D-like protein (predicted 3'-phosphoesterase)
MWIKAKHSPGGIEMVKDSLKKYREKRDFNATAEPAGEAGLAGRGSGERPIFVIQKHAASTLHFDFRIEVGGVLKSWAVPKGPSTVSKDRRLAVPTEDHPFDYAAFEGTIPEGEYGGGTVMIWDRGTYTNIRAAKDGDGADMERSLDEGKVEIELEGERLKGDWAMIRTGKGEKARWLLLKKKDGFSGVPEDPVGTFDTSVATGRTMEEIAADG